MHVLGTLHTIMNTPGTQKTSASPFFCYTLLIRLNTPRKVLLHHLYRTTGRVWAIHVHLHEQTKLSFTRWCAHAVSLVSYWVKLLIKQYHPLDQNTCSVIWSGVMTTPTPQSSSKAATSMGSTGWDFRNSKAATEIQELVQIPTTHIEIWIISLHILPQHMMQLWRNSMQYRKVWLISAHAY